MHRPKFVGDDVQELLSHETRKESPSLSKNRCAQMPCLRNDADMITGAPTTQTAVIEVLIRANVLIQGTLKH